VSDYSDFDLPDLVVTITSGKSGKLHIWLPAVRAGSGADVFTMRLAAALDRRGLEATITWFPHWSELTPDVLRFVKPPAGTDLIHANSAYAFAFKRKGIPLVVTEHHYTLDPVYRPYKSAVQNVYHKALVGPCLRRSYAAADAITTDSLFTARVLAERAGVRTTRTIPLWADYDEFSPLDGAQHVARGNHNFRLLFVGNSSRRKGADVIPLLAQRLGEGFEIRCTAGLRQQTQDESVGNVRMLGRLTLQQLVQEYRDCDAVLVPSRYEGFGYSALEAMACGKPVVGFRCGAIEEIVAEEKTGLLCEVDDIDALERFCKLLANDRLRSSEFGCKGRERAVTVFTESTAVDMYLELYNSLISP
jgi:alpha-maltose-1-phosphate synthase